MKVMIVAREEVEQLQQYLAITEFPDLEYFRADKLCFKELAMIIEKTSGNIKYFEALNKDARDVGMLINVITNNCPMIRTLSIDIEPKYFKHVKPLLLNCKQLKCICFGSSDFSADEHGNNGDE